MALTFNLLTTNELSTLLKRAPETLSRWRRTRVGPPFLIIEGRVLYDETEVRRWIEESRSRPRRRRTRKTPDPADPPCPARTTLSVSGLTFSPSLPWQNTDE